MIKYSEKGNFPEWKLKMKIYCFKLLQKEFLDPANITEGETESQEDEEEEYEDEYREEHKARAPWTWNQTL